MSIHYLNGGMIGKVLEYNDTESYVIGTDVVPTLFKPRYVGGRSLNGSGTTSNITVTLTGLSGGLASNPVEGDFVIVVFGTGSTVDRTFSTSSTGWTKLVEIYSNDDIDTNLAVFYKFMGSTPDTSMILTGGSGSTADSYGVIVHAWRSVDQTTPMDVTQTTATGLNSRQPNPPAITPTTAGAVILATGVSGYNASVSSGGNFTTTNLTNSVTTNNSGSTNDVSIGIGAFTTWTSGAYDPAAWTGGGTSQTTDSWSSITMALRPATIDVETPILGNLKGASIWDIRGQYNARSTATIRVVATSSAATDGVATSIDLTLPNNIRGGDLILIFAGNDYETDTTAQWDNTTYKPTGYTLIQQITTATADASAAAWYKYADGSEDNTTINIPARSSEYMWAACAIVRNVAQSNPIDVTGTNRDNSGATVHAIPAVTTTIDKCLAFFVLSSDGSDCLPVATGGAGWGADIIEVSNGFNDPLGVGGIVGWKYIPTAGTTGIVSVAFLGSAGAGVSDGGAGFQFAIEGIL